MVYPEVLLLQRACTRGFVRECACRDRKNVCANGAKPISVKPRYD